MADSGGVCGRGGGVQREYLNEGGRRVFSPSGFLADGGIRLQIIYSSASLRVNYKAAPGPPGHPVPSLALVLVTDVRLFPVTSLGPLFLLVYVNTSANQERRRPD